MKTTGAHVDFAAKRVAQTRMREIVSLLPKATAEEKEGLSSEFNRLNGSWETVREFDIPDLVTEEEARIADIETAKESARQAIRDKLAASDAKAMRAFFEGDQARIEEHNTRQEDLRKQLREI